MVVDTTVACVQCRRPRDRLDVYIKRQNTEAFLLACEEAAQRKATKNRGGSA